MKKSGYKNLSLPSQKDTIKIIIIKLDVDPQRDDDASPMST